MNDTEKIIRAVKDGMSIEMIERLVTNFAEKQYKDICKHCRGKGYSTNFHGIEGVEDLDTYGWTEPMRVHIEYCSCERGKQLQKVIHNKQDEARMLLLRQMYRNVKRKHFSFDKAGMLAMLRGYWKSLQE